MLDIRHDVNHMKKSIIVRTLLISVVVMAIMVVAFIPVAYAATASKVDPCTFACYKVSMTTTVKSSSSSAPYSSCTWSCVRANSAPVVWYGKIYFTAVADGWNMEAYVDGGSYSGSDNSGSSYNKVSAKAEIDIFCLNCGFQSLSAYAKLP